MATSPWTYYQAARSQMSPSVQANTPNLVPLIGPKTGSTGTTVAGKTSGTVQPQSYAQIPDYTSVAKSYIGDMPNINSMPEYNKAMNWQLPDTPNVSRIQNVDPQYYENQWKLSSDALRKAFYGEGGTNQQSLNSVLDRGLGTSGDWGNTISKVADQFATALANARVGLDSQRMQDEASVAAQNAQQENAVNNMVYGAQTNRANALANAAMSILGMKTNLPMQYGQSLFNIASGLTGSQNDILTNIWNQQFQGNQANAQNELQKAQLDEQTRANRYDQILKIIGEMDIPADQETALAKWFGQQIGVDTSQFSTPQLQQTQTNINNQNSGPYNSTSVPGQAVGQIIRVDGTNYYWTGSNWIQI